MTAENYGSVIVWLLVAQAALTLAFAVLVWPYFKRIPQEQIAERAAKLWLDRGQPKGQDEQNWLDAERELREETVRAHFRFHRLLALFSRRGEHKKDDEDCPVELAAAPEPAVASASKRPRRRKPEPVGGKAS